MIAKISIKFIILGDSGTGKTTLLKSFRDDDKFLAPEATIGLDFFMKQITDQRYGLIEFTLWDTSGTERFNHLSLTQAYYRNAEGIIFCFDISSRSSFDSVSRTWMRQLKSVSNVTSQGHCCILVGTKSDLENRREVSHEEGVALAERQGMIAYIELSALHSDCMLVRKPFLLVAKKLIDSGVCRSTVHRIINNNNNNNNNNNGVQLTSRNESDITCCLG